MVVVIKGHASMIRTVEECEKEAYTTPDGACTVVEVGGSKAGESRLIVPREGDALLIDTGFAWSAPQTWENIEGCRNGHPVPTIALSHSHYDHVDGLGYLMGKMPGVKVACAAHAAHVFSRPGAIKTMEGLEDTATKRGGADGHPPIAFPKAVDRVLHDGDVLHAGDLEFQVLETPGHTRDSLTFWCASEGVLIASETTGVYGGPVPSDWTVPSAVHSVVDMQMLTGYQTTLDAIRRCRALHARVLFCSHCPTAFTGDAVDDYFESAEHWTHYVHTLVSKGLAEGWTDQQILREHKRIYEAQGMKKVQPEEAFDLNAGYTLATVKREIAAEKQGKTA